MAEIKTNNTPATTANMDVKVESLTVDTDSIEANIVLVSKEGQKFEIVRKYAMSSELVKAALEKDPDETEIPLPSVDAVTLGLIVKYLNHHKGVDPGIVERPLKSKIMKENCKDSWDAEYIDEIGNKLKLDIDEKKTELNMGDDKDQLYTLITSANYMDIKSLLHLGCAKVASLIKGEPLEKMKAILAKEEEENDKKDKNVVNNNNTITDTNTDNNINNNDSNN